MPRKNWFPREALSLVGGWLGGVILVCGLWLVSILLFLESARTANSVRLSAHRIRIHELEARRYEKDFILRSLRDPVYFQEGRSEYLEKHALELEALRREAALLESAAFGLERGRVRDLLDAVRLYEEGFRDLVSAYRERGFRPWGHRGRLAAALEGMKRAIEPMNDLNAERLIFDVEEAERAFLGLSTPERAEAVENALDALAKAGTSMPQEKQHILRCIQDYGAAYSAIREIQERIGFTEDLGLQSRFRKAVHAIEPMIEAVMEDATKAADRAYVTLWLCIWTACFIMAVLLGLAIFFAATARLRNRRLLLVNAQMEEDHRKLLQSERLAAIGQMVTGLAHESRNALQRTHACLDILAQEVKDRPRALELVTRIEESQDYLHLLYEQVREYAAPFRLKRDPTLISSVIDTAWKDLEPDRAGRIASLVEVRNGVDLRCHADAFAMEQVFRNILENSLAACSDPVEIRVSYSEAAEAPQPAIEISVLDNGPGLDAQARARIFEPFYTTKVKGTGLGMAIARRLVEAHGGGISVGDRAFGAEIIITLPR